ncbi:hypothetical protein JXA40_10905 [bacterium]|nr:hypothetical protein [candidate division CSSED10-310 bacterium]
MNAPNNTTILPDLMQLAQISLSSLDRHAAFSVVRSIGAGTSGLEGTVPERLVSLLKRKAEFRRKVVTDYRCMESDLSSMNDRNEKIDRMMAFIRTISPENSLKEDRKAFNRWMDAAAVRERARIRLHESERFLEIVIRLLTGDAVVNLKSAGDASARYRVRDHLNLPDLFWVEFDETPRWQNRLAVMQYWIGCAGCLPVPDRSRFLPLPWKDLVVQILENPGANLWVRVAAFRMGMLYFPEECFKHVVHKLNDETGTEDDFYVRAGILDVIAEIGTRSQLGACIDIVLKRPDSSEHVKIRAVRLLAALKHDQILKAVGPVLSEPGVPGFNWRVKLAAVISLGTFVSRLTEPGGDETDVGDLMQILFHQMHHGSHVNVQLGALEAISGIADAHLHRHEGAVIDGFLFEILQNIDRLITDRTIAGRLRRDASVLRELILLRSHSRACRLLSRIREMAGSVPEGTSFHVPAENGLDAVTLGRILAALSSDDFGYYARGVRAGYEITRGDSYRKRFWRIWDEIRRPDPSKRQGFPHSIGRMYRGTIRAHSRLLAETTETKVAGERVVVPGEASWRPYLPTVDDLLSLTSRKLAGRPVRLFSAEGIVTMTGPGNLLDRITTWLRITFSYRELARRRNLEIRQLDSNMERGLTQVAMEDLGIDITFTPHAFRYDESEYAVTDPTVSRNLYPATKKTDPDGDRGND